MIIQLSVCCSTLLHPETSERPTRDCRECTHHPAAESSMVAWFRSEDANPDWHSVVGGWKGRVTKGSITRKFEAGHGAGAPVSYLYGNTGTGYDFGKIMKRDYTICSVTRYAGHHRNRILQTGHHPNWLHGHWAGRVGVGSLPNVGKSAIVRALRPIGSSCAETRKELSSGDAKKETSGSTLPTRWISTSTCTSTRALPVRSRNLVSWRS